jgi:outer membrane lipoprotein-sorting protein
MHKPGVFLLFLSTFVQLLLFSQAPEGMRKVDDAGTVKSMIRNSSDTTFSISSDFQQEKNLTMMEEILLSSGRFLFKKENNVRWEYLKPFNYAIIVSGNRFTINNDGKITEYDTGSNKLFKEINNMIVMAIQGSFADDQDFSTTFYEDDHDYMARLVPVDVLVGDVLQTIEIRFDKKTMAVREVTFIEPGEDYTRIVFSNRQTNIQIADEQFQSP